MNYSRLIILLLAFLFNPILLQAQNCPENIGFEYGNFSNWKISTGYCQTINGKNSITLNQVTNPSTNRHTINNSNAQFDPYGKFPLTPKNSSNYAVKLGNNGTGSQSEGISYLINVPLDKPEFTLTYQYAIVLEDPNHLEAEQPRFIARVKEVSTGKYIDCASFEYIATSNLPGFKTSAINSQVIYKDWSPVTINLSNYAGKQLLLEFITSDCTLNGHFGYAYVDVNNICGNVIEGAEYCKGAKEVKLSGPSGYKEYNWYNETRNIKYGTGQTLKLETLPAENSKIVLDLIPYDGFGCASTVSAILKSADLTIEVKPDASFCFGKEVDITSEEFILNKNLSSKYEVYKDANLTEKISNKIINTENRTYYIKETTYMGCTNVASIQLSIFKLPEIKINQPKASCYNSTVDLTHESIFSVDLSEYNFAYFEDKETTKPIADPTKIAVSGTYYIRLEKEGCSTLFSVVVSIMPKPVLIVNNPAPICLPNTINITEPSIFKGSDTDFTYKFYSDKGLTKILDNPNSINQSGNYYVKATNKNGCELADSVSVIIYPTPTLEIKNPDPVCYPEVVDITNSDLYSSNAKKLNLSYYFDEELTSLIKNPKQIKNTGKYFVKLTNENGCFLVKDINVTINSLPEIVINEIKPIFDDEYADLTNAEVLKGSLNYSKIEYFYDAQSFNKISDPTKINKAGIYFIKLTNANNCSISSSLEIKIIPKPKIVVPTAFTPQQNQNNRLFPFCISLKKLLSFKVFNKWGIMVYETNNENMGWDGQFKNKMQPFETFTWFAEGLDLQGRPYQSNGKTIMIL